MAKYNGSLSLSNNRRSCRCENFRVKQVVPGPGSATVVRLNKVKYNIIYKTVSYATFLENIVNERSIVRLLNNLKVFLFVKQIIGAPEPLSSLEKFQCWRNSKFLK